MKRYRKSFMDTDYPLWMAFGWTFLVAAALCVMLCIADIPHWPMWR